MTENEDTNVKRDPEDPYALRSEYIQEPPVGFWNTVKFLGPGLILVGSVVGSGEIILTTTLGATVGFVMLWWMLLSCWGKSIVQAELGRYAVSSGQTALAAFNDIPGKMPFFRSQISWFIFLWFLQQIPGLLGGGGIYGGAGQAMSMMMPFLDSRWWTIIVAIVTATLILSGTYRFLEKLLTFMVVTFTLITLACAILLQFTEFAITWSDVGAGLRFDFPAFAIAAALAAYGGTGVNAGESMAYTYWCTEKGYARFTGPTDGSEGWVNRARGWIRVMHTDVVVTLIVLTFATIPFYMLGAGVLNRMGQMPDGLDTLSILSNMYTQTLGQWAWWLFMVGGFFVLFSTVVSGLGGGSRMIADVMGVIGVIDPNDYKMRIRVRQIWAVVAPAIQSLCYFFAKNPVWMLTISGTVGAMMMPLVAGNTIYLRYFRTDRRIAPGRKADSVLWICFLAMIGLAIYAIYLQFVQTS